VNRRDALKTAIAAGAAMATAAGCDSATATTSGTPAAQPAGAGTASKAGAPTASASPFTALPPEVSNGPRDRPNVALTFHGQGEPALVDRLLSELETGGARATVLAVGSWLAAQPAMARRILDGGHELGNHTQHHVAIAQLSAAGAYREINECATVLRRLTGSAGVWFRPSQTRHATATIRAEARRAGYLTCLSYDVDSRDYTDPPPAVVVRDTLASLRNGSIVSMHCGHRTTIDALGPILDTLRTRGLRAVTMTQLVSG